MYDFIDKKLGKVAPYRKAVIFMHHAGETFEGHNYILDEIMKNFDKKNDYICMTLRGETVCKCNKIYKQKMVINLMQILLFMSF